MKRFVVCIGLALAPLAAFAAAFTPGDLVVVRAGDGSAALGSAATAAFLQEFTTLGSGVQTIGLPTAANGANQILTLSGSATSEGFLTLSANGLYLTMGGYNSAIGTAGPNNLIGNRVVGRIDLFGNIDTTTILGDASNLGNIRSVVSDNGGNLWANTSGAGVRYTTFGSTTATTQLSTSPSNVRTVNIFSGQLYTTSASSTFQGVATVGTGLPTTSGQTTTLLSGFPTASGPSPYDYVFADANTLYVADDRATGSGGGLQKWTFNGSTWTLAYTLNIGLTAGLRGLTGVADGLGDEILYATTADAITALAGNKLVTLTDLLSATSAGTETFSTVATAPGNTAFRGVELVPEPGSLFAFGAVILLVARRLHRKQC